jgi:hypothetical protein
MTTLTTAELDQLTAMRADARLPASYQSTLLPVIAANWGP